MVALFAKAAKRSARAVCPLSSFESHFEVMRTPLSTKKRSDTAAISSTAEQIDDDIGTGATGNHNIARGLTTKHRIRTAE